MSTAFQIFTFSSQQALDTAANVLSGATLTFSLTGTSTPAQAYSDAGLTAGFTSIAADSAGVFAPIFLDPNVVYRVVLKTQGGATLKTWDPANEAVLTAASFNALYFLTDDHKQTPAEIAAGVTPVNYAYTPGHIFRYGADPTGNTDSSAAIQAAHQVAVALGNTFTSTMGGNYLDVIFPGGTYLVNSTITWSPYVHAFAQGVVIIRTTSNSLTKLFWISTQYGNGPTFNCTPIFRGKFRFWQNVVNANLACFFLGDTGTSFGCANATFENIEIFNFQYGVQFGNEVFILNFKDCFFNSCAIVLYAASSLTNTGERILFQGTVFSENAAVASLNSGIELFFHGCSIDYNNAFGSNLSGSNLYFEGCHFEWNNTTNTLFALSAPGVGMSAHWSNCTFNVAAPANSNPLPNPLIASIGVSTFADVVNCIYNIANSQSQPVVLYNISASTGTFNGPANFYKNGAGAITTYVANTGAGTLHTF